MPDSRKTNRRPLLRAVGTALGALLGLGAAIAGMQLLRDALMWEVLSFGTLITVYAAGALIFSVAFFFLSVPATTWFAGLQRRAERYLSEVPARELLLGAIGLVFGLFIAFLLMPLLNLLPIRLLYLPLACILYGVLGWLGMRVMLLRRDLPIFPGFRRAAKPGAPVGERMGPIKILDTSVIIDGRIFDILRTGFIDGPLVVPEFVLAELQRIADSADALKRNRGRRGLEILEKVQAERPDALRIEAMDFPDAPEVDVKLIRLAEALEGGIVTNDYNLNKVAGLTGVEVFNLNELANAVKPVVLPGEEMPVRILKEGKEAGQGVAYLDDGTMIVVENGKRYVGETVEVVVTSVLQTSAGRMIFTRMRSGEKAG